MNRSIRSCVASIAITGGMVLQLVAAEISIDTNTTWNNAAIEALDPADTIVIASGKKLTLDVAENTSVTLANVISGAG